MSNTTSTNVWPEIRGWCIVYGVEAFLAVAVNGIAAAVIINSSHLHKRFFYLLLSLAIADFLVGAIAAPMFIYVLGGFYQQWPISHPNVITAQTMVEIFTSYASIYSLTAIAFERLIAVMLPWIHQMESTLSYVCTIIITWLLALLTSLFFLVRFTTKEAWSGMFIFIMVLLSLSLLITFVCYAIISIKLCCISPSSTLNTREQKEKRLATTLLLASVIFIACWIPFQAINYIFHFNSKVIMSHHYIYATKFLHYFNSIINPFLYALLIKDFRKGLSQLFCCDGNEEINAPKGSGHVKPVSAPKNEGYEHDDSSDVL